MLPDPATPFGRRVREWPGQGSFHFDSDGHGQDVLVLYGRVAIDQDQPLRGFFHRAP